jgi:uncharacterized coiled-coil protein SlyX
MSDLSTEQRLNALEIELAQQKALIADLADEVSATKQAFHAFKADLQITLGPLIRQVQAENGLLMRASTIEAHIHAILARLADLEGFDAQQKRGPSPSDLSNQLADLRLTLSRLQTADKYALTREKLGRLMVANNIVTPEELEQSQSPATEQVESTEQSA